MSLNLSQHVGNVRWFCNTFDATISQVNVMRSMGQLQMVHGSVPPANQVARRILPMIAVFVEEQCTVRVDRYVFEHFEEHVL
jgi:hypothetical protein